MTAGRDVIDRVSDLLRDVSATAVEPRFRALETGDVREKEIGEVVTRADEEAERLLAAGLDAILPGTPFVGEEACAAEPSRLAGLESERAWLVDPLDGTANFVAGSPDWALMVALVVGGQTAAAWIYQPPSRHLYVAELGAGSYRDGVRLRSPGRPVSPQDLRGAVLTRFLDDETRATVTRNGARFGAISSGRLCSGVEYPSIIEGEEDFALFWRTLPWDHAPGVLLLEEAGGVGRRPDGSSYRPGDPGVGLLVAADQPTWDLALLLFD